MSPRYEEFIQDVPIAILLNLHELEERKSFAAPEELTYIEAKLAAYPEMLAILKISTDEFNIPKEETGL